MVVCTHNYISKPPMAAKRRSLRLPKVQLTPLKTSGFCSAKPKKKPPVRATISNLVQFWLIFTTKLESTSSVKPKSKPRRLFQQSWNAPRQKNPLHF